MTSALKMSKQSPILHKSEIKFNMIKSKYFVEAKANMKMAYFENSGEAMQGPTPVLIQGHVFLQTLSHLGAGWCLVGILTLLFIGWGDMGKMLHSSELLLFSCSWESHLGGLMRLTCNSPCTIPATKTCVSKSQNKCYYCNTT